MLNKGHNRHGAQKVRQSCCAAMGRLVAFPRHAVRLESLLGATRFHENQTLGRRLSVRSSLARCLEATAWMQEVEQRKEQLPRRPVHLRHRAAICTQTGVVTAAPLDQSCPST